MAFSGNRAEAQRKAEVMMAFAHGKKIESNAWPGNSQSWHDCTNPEWDWEKRDYRIKFEPKVVWMVIKENGEFKSDHPFLSKGLAKAYLERQGNINGKERIIKLVEVFDAS